MLTLASLEYEKNANRQGMSEHSYFVPRNDHMKVVALFMAVALQSAQIKWPIRENLEPHSHADIGRIACHFQSAVTTAL